MNLQSLTTIADMYDVVFVNSVDQVDITTHKTYILPYSKKSFESLSQSTVHVELLRFRLLTKSRPRLLVRFDSRDLYFLALNFFNPGSTLAKLYFSLMKSLCSVRLTPSTGTSDYLVASLRASPSIIPSLTPANLIAIYIGTAEPCRKLVALLKNGHKNNIVVKGSTDAKSAQAIDREFNAMKRVTLLGFEKYLPKLEFYKKFDNGLALLITEAVAVSQPDTNLTRKLLLEFLFDFHRIKSSTISIEKWLTSVNHPKAVHTQTDHGQILTAIIGSMPRLPIRISHGDFSIWNILLRGHELKIIDWEELTDDIIFADLFQFHYSKWLCSKKLPLSAKIILDRIYQDALFVAGNDLAYRDFLMYLYLWLTSRSIDQRYKDLLSRIMSIDIYVATNEG